MAIQEFKTLITHVGGYQYQFVTSPPDWLICNICHFPSREPYLSDCCGSTFCNSCVVDAKRTSAICPICHNKEFVTFYNMQANKTVKSLHVFCSNMEKGCEWQGEVNDIINHLKTNSDGCQFEEVTCTNHCGKDFQRQHLTSHLESGCLRRKINCQFCHIIGEQQFIEGEHEKLCPKFLTPCPKKSGKNDSTTVTEFENLKKFQEEMKKMINELSKQLSDTKKRS